MLIIFYFLRIENYLFILSRNFLCGVQEKPGKFQNILLGGGGGRDLKPVIFEYAAVFVNLSGAAFGLP